MFSASCGFPTGFSFSREERRLLTQRVAAPPYLTCLWKIRIPRDGYPKGRVHENGSTPTSPGPEVLIHTPSEPPASGGRKLDRRRDPARPRCPSQHGRKTSQTFRRGGPGSSPQTQRTEEPEGKEDRWRIGGPPYRFGVQPAAGGTKAVDPETAGRPPGRFRGRRQRQP